MNTEGWIKLHRAILDNPYMKNPSYRALWTQLLLLAEHGKKKVGENWVDKTEEELPKRIWKGKVISLKPGQLTTGCKQLAEQTGVPESTCSRILNVFVSERQVERQVSNHFSLIQVINWKRYQMDERPVRNQREASGDNIKKLRNKEINTPYSPPFEEFWKAYPKKVVKEVAWKSFQKIDLSLLPEILKKLDLFRSSSDWVKDGGKFIPHPATWLNQKRWEDELKTQPTFKTRYLPNQNPDAHS